MSDSNKNDNYEKMWCNHNNKIEEIIRYKNIFKHF